MRYTTANLMALPFNKQYTAAIDTVLRHSDMIGWQELTRLEYFRYIMGRKGWATIGHPAWGAAISYRESEWMHEANGTVLLHHGTPAITPERRILWARFHRLDLPNIRVNVTTRHYVSGAWNNKPDPDKQLRQGMWETGNHTDLALLRQLTDSGIPSVHMADGNRMNYPIWGNQIRDRTVQYKGGGGIDYLAFLNGRERVWEISGLNKLDIPGSDHNARIRTARLVLRKGK